MKLNKDSCRLAQTFIYNFCPLFCKKNRTDFGNLKKQQNKWICKRIQNVFEVRREKQFDLEIQKNILKKKKKNEN